jgi:membrane-associated protease RseP (regulator of RpoE activity)
MRAARLDFRKHRLASILLTALFVVSMAISLRSSWDRFDEMLHGGRYVSVGFDLNSQTFEVIRLDSETEKAGLRKRDIVIGVNGRPAQGWSDLEVPVRRARTGDHLVLRVKRRAGAGFVEHDIPVPLKPFTYVGYLPGSAVYVVTILFRIVSRFFVWRSDSGLRR